MKLKTKCATETYRFSLKNLRVGKSESTTYVGFNAKEFFGVVWR